MTAPEIPTVDAPPLVPAGTAERRAGRRPASRVFLPVGAVIVAAFVAMALAPQLFAGHQPDRIYVGPALQPPGAAFWLGTDELGRDLFSRLVYGARLSLGASVLVVAIGALAGTLIGSIAGFVGGVLDDVLMRIVELFLSLPSFVLALAIAAVLGRGMASVVIALAIVWWPGYARLVRGMVLNVKERLHVEAARTLGASGAHILWRHILPFTWAQLNARITQDMGYALVNVAGLSFLGLGAQPPAPEWGALLNASRTYILRAWWYATFPGLAITVWTVGLAMLGDSLSERLGRTGR